MRTRSAADARTLLPPARRVPGAFRVHRTGEKRSAARWSRTGVPGVMTVTPAPVDGQSASPSATRADEPKYLTAAQVAELLQVSVKTISRISLEDSSMPCFRRG